MNIFVSTVTLSLLAIALMCAIFADQPTLVYYLGYATIVTSVVALITYKENKTN